MKINQRKVFAKTFLEQGRKVTDNILFPSHFPSYGYLSRDSQRITNMFIPKLFLFSGALETSMIHRQDQKIAFIYLR